MTKQSSSEEFTGSMDVALKGRSPFGAKEGASRSPRYRREANVFTMPVDDIELEGFYVRQWFDKDAFDRLCASIRENGGVDQPLDVRQKGKGADARFILVAGLRRLRACQEVGIEEVVVRNRGQLTEREALAVQGRENEARKDPDAVDSARLYARMKDEGFKQKEIAAHFGKSEGHASYMVRAGQAILAMSDEERNLLHRSPAIKNSTLQKAVSQADTVAGRRELLLRLARGEASLERLREQGGGKEEGQGDGPSPPGGDTPFYAKRHRDGGRTFRVRWRPADLSRDPASFLQEFEKRIEAELEAIGEALEVMHEDGAIEGLAQKEALAAVDRAIASSEERRKNVRKRLEDAGYVRGRVEEG